MTVQPSMEHDGPGPAPEVGASGWGQPPRAGFDVPVVPVTPRPRGRNPLRWVVAAIVVALVVTSGLGAALLLTGSSGGASALAGYVPADALTYAEVRLDLPGSQRADVAKTLSAFPGFADQAALDAKLGEVYDRILRAASQGKHDYQTEIAPWFGGQLAMAIGPTEVSRRYVAPDAATPSPTTSPTVGLPACTGGDTATPAPSTEPTIAYEMQKRELVLADVKDPAKAAAWVGAILAEKGVTTSDISCDGIAVHVVALGSSRIASAGSGWAILGGTVLVAGDLDSVRLAIASKGAGGLAASPGFQKAVGSLTSDHVAFAYEAVKAMAALTAGAMPSAGASTAAVALASLAMGRLPEWVAVDLRAADGNLVMDTAEPAPSGITATNRASDLAGFAPAGTIALVDVHDVGKAVAALRDEVAADPTLAPYLKQVDTVVGLLGGFDSAVGWIGDAGLALTRSGTSISGGLLIRPDDASAAKHLVTQLRGLADLAGATASAKITDEAYQGATITTVDLSSVVSGAGSGMENMLGGMPVPSSLTLVYAVTDKVVVASADPSFVKAVIDASQGGGSLAGDPRFSSLLGKAGDKVAGLAWVDLAAVRDLVEPQLPADERAKYDSDVRPYLLPFDAMVSSAVVDGGLVRGTTIVSTQH